MEEESKEISERLLDYGASIVKLTVKLSRTTIGRELARQLLRSGTAVGANYEEACGAESKADFVHKLQIVPKEVKESEYWLRLIERSDIYKGNDMNELVSETHQISKIMAKSIITVKKGI